MDKFRNKYRIPSARAYWWDYSHNAAYFVTICTKNRQHYFGEIQHKVMHLSDTGKMAHTCWQEIPQHFPFVRLGAFIIMPNHVHGIVVIDKPDGNIDTINRDGTHMDDTDATAIVETQNFAPLPPPPPPPTDHTPKNQFGPQSQNLTSIIRGFKIGVTKQARLIQTGFAWQPRYHDHIIRDTGSYRRISHYIENNPLNWKEDRFCR